ncbi:MAG: MinD/ParA family protein, partial [Mycolicibacterium sp.]|nr:MinD/ParA family protein [Mycolicibacterium sp.]
DRQPVETDRTPPHGWQAPANPPQPAVTGSEPVLQPIDSDDDRDIVVTRRRRPAAGRGWRKTVAKMTGGRVNPAPSAKQEQFDELVKRIRASLVGVHKVAFVCAKGGVGKTTMAVAVGNAIARERGDRVIAVDVNTDLGSLSARFSEDGGPQANIECLSSLQNIGRYSNVRVHTVQNNDRLEMLGAQNDPRSSYTLGAQDYAATVKILETLYNVILLDCGTSITSPLFSTITNDVSSLVVVAALNAPGVKLAKQSLQWLNAHGFGQLLPRTVVVLNATDRGPALIDVDAAETMFRQLVADVIRVPYDPHLAEGMAIEFTACKPRTRKALMDLAGAVAAHYPARQLSYQMPRHRPAESARV